jgi:hypothetical protein
LAERYLSGSQREGGAGAEGCLLGDAMGMGKTIQTCALLAGLFRGGGARLALVVAPVSCLHAWREELERTLGRLEASQRLEETARGADGKHGEAKTETTTKKHVTDRWDGGSDGDSSDDDDSSGGGGWLQRRPSPAPAAAPSASSSVRVELLTSQLSAAKRMELLASIARQARAAAARRDVGAAGGSWPAAGGGAPGESGGCAVVLCSYGLLGAVKDLGEVESKLAPDGGASVLPRGPSSQEIERFPSPCARHRNT